ncbi:MAG: hypothetical protein NTZ85_11100, partial [Bacteroidia bacterium]|nr:hypothetical protein [Bacteroidia bacterium]
GNLYRSVNGTGKFEKGANPFRKIQDTADIYIRHVAILQRNNTLYVFYSRIGDTPEHIQYSKILLSADWNKWESTTPVSVLEPLLDYEGVKNPVKKSVSGISKKPVRELRDPAIFEENGKIYLIYSVAGESGLAIAELRLKTSN